MSRKNNNPDLTMLALAAYDAIRRNLEEADRDLLARRPDGAPGSD